MADQICALLRPAVAVSRVAVADGCVAVVGADRGLAVHRWLPPRDAGTFTFGAPAEAGFAVEADPAPPRALGAPFAADALSGHCYAVLPGSQARPQSSSAPFGRRGCACAGRFAYGARCAGRAWLCGAAPVPCRLPVQAT